MGNLDADDKFWEADGAFRLVDKEARGNGPRNIDARAFKSVMIDLDAAIPGLTDENLGRAKILKALCCHWLYLNNLSKHKSIMSVLNAPPDPFLKEGLSYALEGRQILEDCRASADELQWANGIVTKISGE